MRSFLVLAMLILGQTATAGPVTLTFDEFSCVDDGSTAGREGAIRYTNPNNAVIGGCGPRVLLGDDGLSQRMKIKADPGTRFDLVSFDVDAQYNIFQVARSSFNEGEDERVAERGGNLVQEALIWDVGPSAELSEEAELERRESHPFMAVTGMRDGEVVARTRFDPMSGDPFAPETPFSDLDELRFSVTANSRSIWSSQQFLFGCDTQCGQAAIDNVALNVNAVSVAPSPVPLPAPFLLLGVGLMALWPLRKLQSQS